ncbi:MAG TPA: MerR family transcriptional regulator [Bryobacteraceae bacterium]|nr:MerR family transcriptional regulator [Bryobacteraceae bacterium]
MTVVARANMADLPLDDNTPQIPDRLYFRIGEVSQLVGVPPHVLRFWEKSFPALSPKKSGTGRRLYRRKDVELLLEVKRLLYERRYTIEGARKYLESRPRRAVQKPAQESSQATLFAAPPALESIRHELAEILALLKRR